MSAVGSGPGGNRVPTGSRVDTIADLRISPTGSCLQILRVEGWLRGSTPMPRNPMSSKHAINVLLLLWRALATACTL